MTAYLERLLELLGNILTSGVYTRFKRLRAVVREEVRRVTAALALSILAATCGFAALAFGAIAILIAAWSSHPVLAASLIAVGFLFISVIALLLLRGNSR